MEMVEMVVVYDPALVTPNFMADHLIELEGVEGVTT